MSVDHLRDLMMKQKQAEMQGLVDGNVKPEEDDRSINSEDCIRSGELFLELTDEQRNLRIRKLWHACIIRAKGGVRILGFFQKLQDDFKTNGVWRKIEDKDLKEKISPIILMPESKFKTIWNFLMILLLVYTATYMPFKIAFIDAETEAMRIFDYIIDVLFAIDIFVNFISAYEGQDGKLKHQPKTIAETYLKTWFFLDIIACLPLQLLEGMFDEKSDSSGGKYNKLLRLLRLPRLYRMLRILRLIKLMKTQNNPRLQKFMAWFSLSSGITRIFKGFAIALTLTHIFACLWMLTAKFENFGPKTWVSRHGYLEKPVYH